MMITTPRTNQLQIEKTVLAERAVHRRRGYCRRCAPVRAGAVPAAPNDHRERSGRPFRARAALLQPGVSVSSSPNQAGGVKAAAAASDPNSTSTTTQTGQRTGVDVHLGDVVRFAVFDGHPVAGLVEPPPDGVQPQRLGLLGGDLDVDLGAGEPGPGLDGEGRLHVGDADTHVHRIVLGDVALPDLHAGPEPVRRRELGNHELALDLDDHGSSMCPSPRYVRRPDATRCDGGRHLHGDGERHGGRGRLARPIRLRVRPAADRHDDARRHVRRAAECRRPAARTAPHRWPRTRAVR